MTKFRESSVGKEHYPLDRRIGGHVRSRLRLYPVNGVAGRKAGSALARSLECFNDYQSRLPGSSANTI